MREETIQRGSVGYSCNLDIADAKTMLGYAVMAKRAGFPVIWASDHFHPWYDTGAHESHAWTWMSTLLAMTKGIAVGTGATCPILRYHPAITAQAFATMEAMHGRRVFITVGAGEALNEVPLGYPWPSIAERRGRVIEAISMMRRLWREDFVDFDGRYYKLREANLYMKASVPIMVAASGPKMAAVAGEMGDGFLTIKGADYAAKELFPAVERGAKKSGKGLDDVMKAVEIDVSYNLDFEKAIAPLRTQRGPLLSEMFIEPIYDPRVIEKSGERISDEELAKAYVIGSSAEDFIKPAERAFKLGFDHVYFASLSPNERQFIQLCKKRVLPYFERRRN